MLIRLLQKFSVIEVVPEAQPEAIPAEGFADSPGSNGSDRLAMKSHLTLYASVSFQYLLRALVIDSSTPARFVGQDD